jgi:hypothetical protein
MPRNKALLKGEMEVSWETVGNLHPDFRNIEADIVNTRLAKYLENNYRNANQKAGISGLTDRQTETLSNLKENERLAYNNLREYRQAREANRIGGKVYSADITASDVLNKNPVTFKEAQSSRQAVRDLKREFQQTENQLKVSTKYKKNIISELDLPTTILDVEAITSVPMTKKIAGRVERGVAELKRGISEHLRNERF